MIVFSKATKSELGMKYVEESLVSRMISGDRVFTKRCSEWFEKNFSIPRFLLTTSCTHALEMAAILCEITDGDEVIMPSYTFVSTANAFVMRGAKIVFVDIRPDTMNIDENLIEAAITKKTKAIVVMHYAGVACEMEKILTIAKKHKLFVIEDAAQAVMAKYRGKHLGTLGEFGCYSFHETKNYTMGEGGALLIRDKPFIERAEIIREKGTDRSKFFRGEIDKYGWTDIGSSYLPSDINAAYLFGQIEEIEKLLNERMGYWKRYQNNLQSLQSASTLELADIPDECEHNAHMFYIKTADLSERARLINFLKKNEICAVFHYIPLHNSLAGKKFSKFCGQDIYTTKESERLLRLPLYHGITSDEIDFVCDKIKEFYS
jgi:dTDP-4-amino-4,6-dideoxygalactose transaminase